MRDINEKANIVKGQWARHQEHRKKGKANEEMEGFMMLRGSVEPPRHKVSQGEVFGQGYGGYVPADDDETTIMYKLPSY